MGHDVTELPETAYHYTRLQHKKGILQKGLVVTDNYNKGDTPVVWFYCVRQEIMTDSGGGIEVRVKVDKTDKNWRIDWGGAWDSIVYTGNIPPEKLTVENTADIAREKRKKFRAEINQKIKEAKLDQWQK